MDCHECAAIGMERTAGSTCRFCSVSLCKDHLVPERPYAKVRP